MSEYNSIEKSNIYSNLSDQIKIRLNEINKIKDYFNPKIQKIKLTSKNFSKYIATFGYIGKILIALVALPATSDRVSIISFVNVIGAPVVIASASLSFVFSLTTGIIKTLLSLT